MVPGFSLGMDSGVFTPQESEVGEKVVVGWSGELYYKFQFWGGECVIFVFFVFT